MPELERPRPGLRSLLAPNPGPFTLRGTRVFLLGSERLAILDPGPSSEEHLRALEAAAEGARTVTLVLTHGHGDHAACAEELAGRLGCGIRGYGPGARPFSSGEGVETDAGSLIPVETPGHTRQHYAYHWPEGSAVFVGDLLLGVGRTTWVAEYPGCVADYLDSLDRLEGLAPQILYPAHGPALRDPGEAIRRFREHRMERIRQVARALEADPRAGTAELVRTLYGADLDEALRTAATRSVEALVHHVRSQVAGG